MPRKKPLFLCDSMLGKLCRWLRILGFKCVSASEVAKQFGNKKTLAEEAGGQIGVIDRKKDFVDDELLLRACLKLGAVLLTRDEALFQRAQSYVKAVFIRSNSLEEQAAFVIKKFDLTVPLRPRESYCPACGSVLKRVRKQLVKEKVFARVFERQKRFWQCPSCGSLYWQGTHWEKIIERGMRIGAAIARG